MGPKIQTIVAELHRHFEALYGDRMVQMVLFGSQARGDAEPGSASLKWGSYLITVPK